MQHYVVFHNHDKQKRAFNGGRVVGRGGVGHWSTSKNYRTQTLLNNQLWGIEGGGSPKNYRLVCSGQITRIDKWRHSIEFEADASISRIDVTNRPWFKILLKEQGGFRYGLNRIRSSVVITELKALRDSALLDDRPAGNKNTSRNWTTLNSKISQSPLFVRETISRLCPERSRSDILDAIAHSVQVADREAPGKWGLRLNTKSVMLKVGFVEVLQFGEGWFHLLLASKLINSRERANRQFHFSKCTYKNAPGCEFSDVNDAATFEAAYSRLSSAHEQAIRIAALSRIHTTTAKDHSPALVRVLR